MFDHIWRFDTRLKQRLMRRWRRSRIKVISRAGNGFAAGIAIEDITMAETYQLDALDRAILQALMANARTSYAELAEQLNVSPGTVHVRVEK